MNTYASALKEIPLFTRLSSRSLDQLAARAALVKLPKGSVVYREGDAGDALYVVLAGRCRSVLRTRDGVEHALQDFTSGETFGERALLTGDRHGTTVQVLTDATLLRIHGDEIQHLLDRHPPLARQMVRRMNEQIGLLRGELSRHDPPSRVGRTSALAIVSGDPSVTPLLHRLSQVVRRVSGETTLLLCVRPGPGVPSLADWRETPSAPGAFALSSHLRADGDVAQLSIFARGEPSEPDQVAALAAQAIRHFRHVLILLPAELPAPLVTAFLHQSDRGYIFLRQRADDLYRANLLVRHVRGLPGGELAALCPVLCVDEAEDAAPGATLAGQVGVEMHAYVRGIPSDGATGGVRLESHLRYLAREIARRRVGLALSSGGAKGLAHIGVIQVLEENHIEVDVIAGSSMGAYIGALWAFGFNGRQMEQMALQLERRFAMIRLIDFSFTPRRGFMKGERVRAVLEDSIGRVHFSELQRVLRVTATDLDTLDRVVFDSGPVAPAVQASMAMPGVIVPVTHEGRRLIDGGAADPIPVDVLQEMSVEHIVAVNTIPNPEELKACRLINEQYAGPAALPPVVDRYMNYFSTGNILDTFTRSMHAAETRIAEAACRNADVVLRAVSCDGRWHDFRNARKYIALGRRVAEENLEAMRALVRAAA